MRAFTILMAGIGGAILLNSCISREVRDPRLKLEAKSLNSVRSAGDSRPQSDSDDPILVAKAPGNAPLIDKLSLAEPVSPRVAKLYPHLRPYSGHIVIGNDRVQVIAAGVGPKPLGSNAEPWRPLVLGVFEKRQGRWFSYQSFNALSLNENFGASGNTISPKAIDVGIEKSTGEALITYAFSGEKSPETFYVQLRLNPLRNILHLLVQNIALSTQDKKKKPSGNPLRLRLKYSKGTSLPHAGSEEAMPYGIYSYGDEIMAIGSYQPIKTRGNFGAMEMTTEPQAEILGISLAIGNGAASSLPAFADIMKACSSIQPLTTMAHTGSEDYPAAAAEWLKFSTCLDSSQKSIARFYLEDSGDNEEKAARPIYIMDENLQGVTFAMVYPNEVTEVMLPPQKALLLAHSFAADHSGKSESIKLEEGESRQVKLSKIGLGTLTIDGLNEAAFVNIGNLEEEKHGWFPVFPDRSVIIRDLSPNSFVTWRWPLKMKIAEGAYRVRVFNGSSGVICEFATTIIRRQESKQDCGKGFLRERERLDKDLPFTGMDPATLANKESQGKVEQLLGVRLLASNTEEESGGFVRQYVAAAEELGLTVRAFPVRADFEAKWRRLPKMALSSGGVAGLEAFVTFVRKYEPKAMIELGCPPAQLSSHDFRRILERTRPDLIQIFGCGDEGIQNALFEAVNRRQQSSSKPLKFATVSGIQGEWTNTINPRLIWFPPEEGKVDWTGDIRDGNFTLSAGVLLKIEDYEVSESSAKSRKSPSKLKLEVTLKAVPGVKALTLKGITEKGLTFAKDIAAEDLSSATKLAVEFPILVGAKWLRLEVWGIMNKSQGKERSQNSSPQLMAASNFMEL